VSERRTKVNPPKTRRYELKCRRNQDRFVILGRARRVPDDWAGGDRRRGGVSRTQAFAWNCGNQTPDAKGEAQAEKTARREYRCRGLGRTDLYERGWPCNGAGAKGSGQVVVFLNQLETG
jgi:hypothetical protein